MEVKEHPILQRLDLIGLEGHTLLHIEYQLTHFEELRDYIVGKGGIKQTIYPPHKLSKSTFYHMLYLLGIVGFPWLGWYVKDERPILGYVIVALVVILLGYEYITTVYCLWVDYHACVVKYPFKSVSFQYNDIIGVNLTDSFQKGARHPEVQITIKNHKKPLILKNLGIDAVLLYKNLKELLDSVHPEIGKFGRDCGALKI